MNIAEIQNIYARHFYDRFIATSNTQKGYIPTGRISFDSTEFDYLGNFEHSTGIFTASRDGLHAFFFSGYLADSDHLRLDIFLNGVLNQYIYRVDVDSGDHGQVTFWWTMNMKKGDEVYLSNYYSNSLFVSDDHNRMYYMGYYVD